MSAKVPQLRRHCRGYAFIQHRSILSKDHRLYLGKWGSAEARKRYAAFLERLGAGDEVCPVAISDTPTITEVIAVYLQHAKQHYKRGERVSYEYALVRDALKPLKQLHGAVLACQYGPRLLIALRTHLAKADLARSTVNHNLSRIKRMFKWASQQEIAPADLYYKLVCVEGLYKGQHNCREADPVKPAATDSIQGVLPYVSPTVAAMLQVQFYCGMRPGEVCIMRACDIDTTGRIWLYKPLKHKNLWRGHEQVKAIPTIAQKILKRFMGADREAYLFDPAEGRDWAMAKQLAERKPRTTKRYPCEVRRLKQQSRNRARRVNKTLPGEHYTASSYRRALFYGFDRAAKAGVSIEQFSPNQVRHSVLTFVSQQLGQQAAQRWGGHENLSTTNIYTERQTIELIAIANQLEAKWSA